MSRPKVVILGAGFGGLTAARALEKDTDVTLVDRHNFQTFLPLLYQVSTAGLAADHAAAGSFETAMQVNFLIFLNKSC